MGSRFLIVFVLWMAFAFGLLQSVSVTVDWWHGESAAGAWE